MFSNTLRFQLVPALTGRNLFVHPTPVRELAITYPTPLIRAPTGTIRNGFACISDIEDRSGQHTCQLKWRNIHSHTIININTPCSLPAQERLVILRREMAIARPTIQGPLGQKCVEFSAVETFLFNNTKPLGEGI